MDRDRIVQTYPEYVTVEQTAKILRLSKRKCSWMLKNGILPCKDSGKKTRQYSEKTISIKHKVLSEDDGPQGYDVMKTKSSFRTMPLLPFIEEELRKEKARQAELKRVMGRAYIDEYDDYVCTDALGRLYDHDYVTNHFKVILKRNKLRDIRFHELRHSCASLLLAKGIPMKMIQDWLGHSDMATTANIYSHIDSTSKKETAQAIGELLG